jgi:hypothetical protein
MARNVAFHPAIYRIIAGLIVLLLLSVWGFAGSGRSGLALTVVSLFILVTVALTTVLYRIWRRNAAHGDGDLPVPLRDWLADEFDSGEGRLTGAMAAASALLPLIAVALGMAIFAVVRDLSV